MFYFVYKNTMSGTLYSVVNWLASQTVAWVQTLATGSLWNIVVFFVAIALLFVVVGFLKRK